MWKKIIKKNLARNNVDIFVSLWKLTPPSNVLTNRNLNGVGTSSLAWTLTIVACISVCKPSAVDKKLLIDFINIHDRQRFKVG